MTEKKICPLNSIGAEQWVTCKGEECAWWDTDTHLCAVLSLVTAVEAVADVLDGDRPIPYKLTEVPD